MRFKKDLEMNGNRYLIDTNIAIFLLAGDLKIAELLNENLVYFSFISELELQSFKKLTSRESTIIDDFLNDIVIIDINSKIKKDTIELRKKTSLKLPDAIIAATAKFLGVPILTADQQFKDIKEPQVILYYP